MPDRRGDGVVTEKTQFVYDVMHPRRPKDFDLERARQDVIDRADDLIHDMHKKDSEDPDLIHLRMLRFSANQLISIEALRDERPAIATLNPASGWDYFEYQEKLREDAYSLDTGSHPDDDMVAGWQCDKCGHDSLHGDHWWQHGKLHKSDRVIHIAYCPNCGYFYGY